MYAVAYKYLEDLLTGAKDDPKSVYDFAFGSIFDMLWSKPYVDCKYAVEGKYLKPSVALSYDILAAFHREGRLRSVVGMQGTARRTKFWLE